MAMYNYGCEAIIRGTVTILSRFFGNDLQFVMPSHEPEYMSRKLADLANFEMGRFSLIQRIKRIIRRELGFGEWYKTTLFPPELFKGVDCVLSVGGDLYTLDCGGDIPWHLLGIGGYCFDHRIPYVIWGSSIGPFEQRPDRLPLVIEHLKRTDLILARDNMTVEYLASKSVTENVRQVADPAFWMEPEPFDIERFLPKVKDKPLIGINFSPLAQRYYPDKPRFIPEIVRTCEAVVQRFDVSVVLVPHVMSPFDQPSYDDRLFHQKVYNSICDNFKNRVSMVSEDIGSRSVKFLLSKMDYFAGARMHSTIASLSTKVPTISLAYSRKGEALNQIIFGHDHWVLRIADFTTEKFCEKLRRLFAQKYQVKRELAEKIPPLKQQALKAGIHVRDLLT
jgi:colanic acid/amylovoran biosynthesis protein